MHFLRTLKVKFILIGILSVCLVITLVMINNWASSQAAIQSSKLALIARVTQRHMEGDMMHDAIRGDVLGAILASKNNDPEGINQAGQDLAEHYEKFNQNLTSNQQEQLPEAIHSLFSKALLALDNYHEAASDVIGSVQQQQNYATSFADFEEKFDLMEEENESISERIDEWTSQEEETSLALTAKAQKLTLICSIFTILCAVLVPIFAWLSIFRPLNKMTSIMQRIKDGNFDIQIDEEKRKDEIGSIATAVAVFRDSGKERVRLEKEQKEREVCAKQEQVSALKAQEDKISAEISGIIDACSKGDFTQRIDLKGKEGLLLKLSHGMNNIGETSLRSVQSVQSAIKALAEGNLTYRMEGKFLGIFAEMQQSFNHSIEQLYSMVKQVNDAATLIKNASSEIASGSDDLSRRTENQAATLEQTSAAMNELTANVNKNTENATQANLLSEKAKQTAVHGGSIVRESVEAVTQIERSSKQILEIIGTIEDIAFQTNLLALNAAVEAARAGESGKGFAVVAAEVRSLAVRAAGASKEISDLLNKTVGEVKSGTELVTKSGSALEEIVSSVEKVASLIADISSASKEQAQGVGEINVAVSQIDETTQQNAALVEESTAAARSMSEQAEQLDRLISFFKLDNSNETSISIGSNHFNNAKRRASSVSETAERQLLLDAIKKAIGAHGKWKLKLKTAIDTKSSEVKATDVAKDNLCEFGAWLYSNDLSPAIKQTDDYNKVKNLHAQFHKVAGAILHAALKGQTDKAEEMLETEYHDISEELISELSRWREKL